MRRIHSSAEIEHGVTFGATVSIWRWVHVRTNVKLGEDVSLGQGCFIDEGVWIGAGTRVQNHVSIYRGVHIGDHCFIGPSVVFTNDLEPRVDAIKGEAWTLEQTFIEDGVSIGANATILAGITIGRYAMVGAGSVVTRDVPPYSLVRGNPARLAGLVCRRGHHLTSLARQDPFRGDGRVGDWGKYVCGRCGDVVDIQYRFFGGDDVVSRELGADGDPLA